ncbi:MAG: type II toxin-antitoxin system VapC family toxin [bacterium]|nr:type II toxin-antitoxin system VapC family toxin [bacterium]
MFIDTNVFVSARSARAPHNSLARAALSRAQRTGEPLRINRQVLREYLSTMTRPQTWQVPLSLADTLNDLAWLSATFEILEDGAHVTDMLVALCQEVLLAGKQLHDANIVATMLAHGERRLLTFNASDFRRYGERIDLIVPDVQIS